MQFTVYGTEVVKKLGIVLKLQIHGSGIGVGIGIAFSFVHDFWRIGIGIVYTLYEELELAIFRQFL